MLRPAILPVIILSAALLYSCKSRNDHSPKPAADPVSVTAQIAAETGIDLDSLHLNFSDVQTERYTVTSDRSSVLTSAKGLRVTVDPSILETESGRSFRGKINVNIVELTNPTDFFMANTATVSNGQLLASGGSYYIGMNAGGERLRIKSGKAMTVEFPLLRQSEMELFYGERNADGNMNWNKAGIPLRPAPVPESVDFSEPMFQAGAFLPDFALDTAGNAKVFKTLNEKVFLYSHHITINALLDSVNKHERRLYIDTVNMWPVLTQALRPGQRIDTGFLLANYGPQKQFIIKSVKQTELMKAGQARFDSLVKARATCYEPKTLAGQILKYYAPAQVTSLGWLNCDRFYKSPENTDAELDIPIAMRGSRIKYFLLFPKINSLLTDMGIANANGLLVLPDLPRGQEISFIGFVKSKGKIYQCRQSFTPGNKEHVKANFDEVSEVELKQIFGANIKT